MTRRGRVAILLLANVVVFILVEGAASAILGTARLTEAIRTADRQGPTHYDSELGWTNKPNLSEPSFFGPGVGLYTNALGARSDRPTSPVVPRGRVRVVCSGDSFTFGHWVSNESTWCHLLEALDPRLTTVNLGVNGYGLDQAYLRYRRDLEGIDHDVHVFAFIADDFRRMRDGLFRGGPKPTLVIEDGRLAVQGVPVPRLSSARVLMRRVRDQAVINFRSLELVRRLFPFLGRKTCAWNGEGGGGPSDSLRPVVDKLFGALSDATTTRDAALVLTYLPCVDEYRPAEVPQWRAVAREMAVRHGIPFVDLSLDLNDLPREKAEGFFIGGFVREPFVMADGHYTVNGNAFFARALYRRLRDIPVVAAQLNRVPERMAEGDSGTP